MELCSSSSLGREEPGMGGCGHKGRGQIARWVPPVLGPLSSEPPTPGSPASFLPLPSLSLHHNMKSGASLVSFELANLETRPDHLPFPLHS